MTTRRYALTVLLLLTFGCAQKPIQSADAATTNESITVIKETTETTMINPFKGTAAKENLDSKGLAKKAFPKKERKPAAQARKQEVKPEVPKPAESAPIKAPEDPKVELEANPMVGNFFVDHWMLLLGFAVIFAVSFGIYRVAKPRV